MGILKMQESKIPETQDLRFEFMVSELMTKFDKTKTGSLSKPEFQALIEYFIKEVRGMEIPEGMAEVIFNGIDENEDQMISMEELKKSMRDQVYPICEDENAFREIMEKLGLKAGKE